MRKRPLYRWEWIAQTLRQLERLAPACTWVPQRTTRPAAYGVAFVGTPRR